VKYLRLAAAGSVLAGAALAVPLLVSPSSVPRARADGVTTEAVFNNPVGTAAQQRAIVNRIVQLIAGAPAGSRIRMSVFYADDPAIPTALVDAKNRGVNVQVMFDHKEASDDAKMAVYNQLVSGLGTSKSAGSWVMMCPTDRGCIGNRTLGTVKSINHNKFYLFSSTGGTSNVVVQSSANLHNGRDGTLGWNNALILAGNDPIYQQYSAYFDDMAALRTNNNYYDTRTPVTSGDAKIHFFPRQETSGVSAYNDPSEDTMATVLDHIDCFGNTTVGTSDNHRTIIRVNQNIFSRTYLASRLVALDKAGCYVEVVENYERSASDSQASVSLNTLLAKTSSAYHGVLVRYYCDNDTTWTHSKYLLVEGKYYGVADRKIVWTGSANWSTNSLRQADESILQLEDSAIFGGYAANFAAARDNAPHQPANGAAISC